MGDSRPTAEQLTELTRGEGGIWRVVTHDSQRSFTLDEGTVTRVPGLDARPSINDRTRPLRTIDALRIGARGRWSMDTDGWSDTVDWNWHVSSVVARIERVTDADSRGSGHVPD
jgi:hypothetical protein